jgi:hypothetical protein
VIDESLAGKGARAHDHIQHAFGKAGVEGQLGEAHRRERGDLRRLEHDAVATGQRGPDLPRRDEHREVPRGDEPDDAEWLVERVVDPAGYRIVAPWNLSTAPA